MKLSLLSLWIVGVLSTSSAQDLKEIDVLLTQEKSYQSLFYLNQIKREKAYAQPLFRFKVNNRLLEGHQIQRSPPDSIALLVRDNESLFAHISDPAERQYFLYLKTVASSSANPQKAIDDLSAISFSTPKLQGYAYLKIGDWLQDARKYDASVNYFIRALTLLRQDSALYYMKVFRCHYLLGYSYKNAAKYDAAEMHYKIALNILATIPDPMYTERVRVLNNLGNVFNETHAYSRAKQNYTESLIIKETVLKDSGSTATTYNNLATFYMRFGNQMEAKACMAKAMQLTPKPRTAKDVMVRNSLISNYSGILREFGEFSLSQQVVQQALNDSRDILPPGDATMIRLHLRSIEDATILNNYAAATREVNQIMELTKPYPPDDPLWIDINTTLSNYFIETKQYDSGFHLSLRIIDQLKSKPLTTGLLFYPYLKAGNAAEKIRSIPEAITYYHEAYRVAVATGQASSLLFSLHALAIAHHEVGELDSAEWYTRRIIALNVIKDSLLQSSASEFIDIDIGIAALMRNARIALDRYRLQPSEAQLNHASDEIGICLRWIRKKREGFTFENDRFEFGDKVQDAFRLAIDIYYEQFRRTGKQQFLEALFEVAEFSKTQSLISNLKRQGVGQFAGITQAIYQQEEILARQETDLLHSMSLLATRSDYNPEVYEEQRSEFRKLELVKSLFLDSIRRHLPGYYQLKYDHTLVTLNELGRVLPNGTLLLEYASGLDSIYVIGVQSRGQFILRAASHASLERSVKSLRNDVKFKMSEELMPVAKSLYTQLIHSADSTCKARKWKFDELLIIPEGPLTLMPFELLITDTRHGPHYLVEKYAIYYNYSATLHWQKSTDPSHDIRKGLAGFAPVFNHSGGETVDLREEIGAQQFSELPETRAEVGSIASMYEHQKLGKSQVFDATATKATFKKMEFEQLSLVHLATHGFAGSSGRRSSGIVFGSSVGSQDNILFAEEVYGLHMPVELVTLSACETGLGKFYSGEGLVGLTRAFFYAGARSLMVSMWKVQDASTAELMKNFYQSYFDHTSDKADALRVAKLKMLHSKNYSDPYYWSAFVLIGANP